MIVSCPNCKKTYKLPASLLENVQHTENGFGWPLSCASCHAHWWHSLSKEKIPSNPSVPTTIELAAKEPEHVPIMAESINEKLIMTEEKKEKLKEVPIIDEPIKTPNEHQAKYEPKPRRNDLGVKTFDDLVPRPSKNSKNKPPVSSKLSFRKIFGIIFILITMTLALMAGLIYLFQEHGQPQIIKILPNKPQAAVLPLTIREVKYDTQLVGDRKTILVVGEVYNQHKESAQIKPLKIVIWGTCSATSSKPQEQDSNGSCAILAWHHQWDRSQIMPGERMLFQSVNSLPANQMINRVDVTLP